MNPNEGRTDDAHAERIARARRLEQQGRHQDAFDAWTAVAGACAGSARADALAQQARLIAGPLGDVPAGQRLYRRALANDPTHQRSLQALDEAARSASDWLRLALVTRLRFERAPAPGERAALALEAGRLQLEKLHSPAAARRWLEAGLEAEPDAVALHEALADIERARSDDAGLLEQLERSCELRGDAASPAALLEAASLRSERGDQSLALRHLERAAGLAADDALVLDALGEELARAGRFGHLADVLERRAALALDDPAGRAAILVELAELQEEALFDPDAANDAFQRAYDVDPSCPGAAEGLTRLHSKLEVGRAAAPSTAASQPPADPEAVLAERVRQASETSDRARLGELVLDIERLNTARGTPEEALPWVQRWVRLAPEQPLALRALARLHDRPGQEAELTATLEALDRFLPPGECADNRRRLGSLYLNRGVQDAAVRAFESALEIEPANIEALEGVVTVCRERGDVPQLITAQWRLAEQLDPPRRADTLAEVARLQERNGDLAGAIATLTWMERDGRAEPERLDALLMRTGCFQELAQRLHDRSAQHEPDSLEAIDLDLERATLLLEHLDGAAEAAHIFREALNRAPESPDAKAGLERALRASIDAEGLAAFLAEQAATADPETRERSELERAVLLEEMLDRGDEARALYQRLAAEGTLPDLRSDAARRHERLLERSGEWEALRSHLEQVALTANATEQERLFEKLAIVCADRLRDDDAELAYLGRVVATNPSRPDVWRQIGDRYERDGDTEAWRHAMGAELEAEPEIARALTLHARLAELALARNDREAATPHFARVFELNPAHTTAASFLIDHHREAGDPEEVIRVLEARLAALGEPTHPEADPDAKSPRTSLRMQIAQVRAAELDDLEGSISALEVALGEAGPASCVAEPLAGCYQRAGYVLDLVELCRNAAAHCSEPGERANWLVRLGDAFLDRGETRAAADAYRQALSQRPDDRALQASLREIYRQHGDAVPLAKLLEAELTHLAGQEEIAVRLELAGLLGDPLLDRLPEALIHTQRVLQLDPTHPMAFERAVELAGELGDHETVLELLDARLPMARTASARAGLQVRRARALAESPGRVDAAIDAYRAALAEDPSAAGVRDAYAMLLEREERWGELLSSIEADLHDLSSQARQGQIERAIAIATDRVSLEAALPWLERLRASRPGDAGVLSRIAHVHRAAGRSEALLQTLEEQALHESDPARQREVHLERAALLDETRGAPGRAAAALATAREIAPHDPVILQRLADLQQRLGHHAERATTLEALLGCPGTDLLATRTELADQCADALHDPARAALHWRAALAMVSAESPQRVDLLRAQAQCELRAGHREAWAQACEQELSALDPVPVFEERRREIRRALADAYHAELGRPGDALRHLRVLLDGDALGSEERSRLEVMCLGVLRSGGDPLELERRLAQHAERHPDDAGLWLELAQLREELLHATMTALAAYRRALDCEPDSRSALRGMRRTAECLGRWSDVADALQRELDHPDCTEPAERAALLRRLGDLWWHRLQSTTRASRCYAAALEADARDFASLRALERLLEAMEDWRGAVDLYESEVEVLGDEDPARTREAWLRVASIAADHLDDVPRARRAYERAEEIAPLKQRRLLHSAELHERAADHEAFAEAFGRWCDAGDTGATPDDHLRLATALEALGRIDDAVIRVDRALALDAELTRGWTLAARLLERAGDLAASAEALRRAAELLSDDEAAPILVRAATQLEPSDPLGALELVRTATVHAPGNAAVYAARACLALGAGLAQEAEACAGRALALDAEERLTAEQIATVARVGGDAARALCRLEPAAGFYGRAIDADPDDRQAEGAYGETLAALGDHEGARRALEARLDRGDDYPERAQHATTLGECLESQGALEEALARFEAAISYEPRLTEAHEGAVRVYESLGQLPEGIAALERWVRATPDPVACAELLLRCARWEHSAGNLEADVEGHVCTALRADPRLHDAWKLRIELLIEAGRFDEAAAMADRAAHYAASDEALATLALLQARAYEDSGQREEAAVAFGLAAEADPRRVEAALARARLLRGFGEWRAAAEALEAFALRHDWGDGAGLSEVHEQLGRLRAGPLEEIDLAIASYRCAVRGDPHRLGAHAALAELLSHRPGDWDEALFHHRIVLAADPTNAGALRVALRVARGRESARSVTDGIHILHALGVAAPHELEGWTPRALSRRAGAPSMEDPLHEKLRRLLSDASQEIGEALETAAGEAGLPAGDAETRFRSAVLDAEAKLSAPALLPLSTPELAEVVELLAALALEPDEVRGDGRLVNALAGALRRRQRRKLRRILDETTLEEIQAVDFEAWRAELRGLAGRVALRESDAGLRTALVSLLRDDHDGLDDPLPDEADLSDLVAASPVARALLRRVVSEWIDGIR